MDAPVPLISPFAETQAMTLTDYLPRGVRSPVRDRLIVFREGDAMVIDCRGCGFAPVPGSAECLGCMVRSMASSGGSDRIVLRTGRDVEVSGRAARAVRDVASMMRWSSTTEAADRRCRICPVSRTAVMTAAWSAFPSGTVFEGRKDIRDGPPDRDGCAECVMRTSRMLDQIEAGLLRVESELSAGGGR